MKARLAFVLAGLALVASSCSYTGYFGVTAGNEENEIAVLSGCSDEGFDSVWVTGNDRRGTRQVVSIPIDPGDSPRQITIDVDALRAEGLRFPLEIRADIGAANSDAITLDDPLIEPGLVLVSNYPEADVQTNEEFLKGLGTCAPRVWPLLVLIGVVLLIGVLFVVGFFWLLVRLNRRTRRKSEGISNLPPPPPPGSTGG